MDTNFQQVESNKFLITIANAESLNHVVVFLTGITPIPPGTAGCIFFSLPDPNAPPNWNYLGYLSNEKPSAIFKLSNLTLSSLRKEMATNPSTIDDNSNNYMAFNYTQAPVIHVAQIGISIEPINSVAHMVPAIETTASNVDTFTEFINKTISNLFNYCSSFSRTANDIMGNPFQNNLHNNNNVNYIPLSSLQTWYENYTRRLSNDQNFWKTLN